MANLKNTIISDTGYLQLPSGTTAQRPESPSQGMIRWNSSLGAKEYYNGSVWALVGINTIPITTTSGFSLSSGYYIIKPNNVGTPFLALYSGNNYKSTGTGYFLWWQSVDQSAPNINLYGQGHNWLTMMVEKQGSSWHTAGFSTHQTFNQRNSTATATSGTRSGYRVYFGFSGGHGIYNTGQATCNWGTADGAIGAGWDGSTCGSFPDNLIMGEGQSNTATYTNRGGIWNFWFSF